MGKTRQTLVLLWICCLTASVIAEPNPVSTNLSQRIFTSEGWPTDKKFFPIAVWLQNPGNAQRYRAAGFNLYVGLWRGPTAAQLDLLQKAGMAVICEQNQFALENKDNPIIAGWMHGDEPDNAQSLGKGKGYGPPISPGTILSDYERLHSADPSRPVMLNLGQGVAWDGWHGRGIRTNHPEDYPEYLKGCDIASFDIYPVVHDSPEVVGKLEFVARGAERLAGWTRGQKPVWTCIECTHISNPEAKPTPQQVRSEAWMALIRGAHGLIYFVHQFKPSFREAALLDDPDMLRAVTDLNRQILQLAPMLNSPTIENQLTVQSSVALATMVKRGSDGDYVFAVNLSNQSARATFSLRQMKPTAEAEVLAESRRIAIQSQQFADQFGPYAVHLYRLPR